MIVDTTVVNMRNAPWDAAIDRTSLFGNPFHIGKDGNRVEVLAKYRVYFYKRIDEDPEFKQKVLALRGLRLGCHCAPLLCHGMTIAEYIENYYAAREAVKQPNFNPSFKS